MYDFDLFVVGAGSGGVRASRMAASLGARVGVCEDGPLGGTCVNVGCVPKKLMVLGSHFGAERHDAAGFGWSVGASTHDWATLIANKDREIARLNGVYERLLQGRGVEVVRGRGKLLGPHELEVAGRTITAKNILLAVGGRPIRPKFPGAEHAMVSDDVFHRTDRPRRMLILGGGYIAVEFAGIFRGYGSEVTLVHRGELFLRGFDRDVRVHLAAELQKKGVELRFSRNPRSLEKTSDGMRVTLDGGEVLEVDGVLAAIGREPRTRDLGLEAVGVQTDPRGAILVDERFRTSVASVYAIGDVIDRVALTPVALAEGMVVARNLFGGTTSSLDYQYVPSAVFSDPPVGTVGLTEDEARAEYGGVDVYKSTFTPLKQTLGGGTEKTLMKLVVDRATDRVVGLHVVGGEAGELVQGFAVALKCGATKAQFDATIGIHPTAAEELVTMRERCPEPDHAVSVEHHEDAKHRKIVHHRWGHDG